MNKLTSKHGAHTVFHTYIFAVCDLYYDPPIHTELKKKKLSNIKKHNYYCKIKIPFLPF